MPYKDPEIRKAYIKKWKQTQHEPRIKLTEEERILNRKNSRKKYVEKNREKVNTTRQIYCDNNPQKRLLWAAKKRSKEQNLPFNLEETDIIIPNSCPYLGIPLQTSARRGESRERVLSLDKIKPELGYVKGNVEVISHLANTMKSNATEEQLIAFATEILKRYNK